MDAIHVKTASTGFRPALVRKSSSCPGKLSELGKNTKDSTSIALKLDNGDGESLPLEERLDGWICRLRILEKDLDKSFFDGVSVVERFGAALGFIAVSCAKAFLCSFSFLFGVMRDSSYPSQEESDVCIGASLGRVGGYGQNSLAFVIGGAVAIAVGVVYSSLLIPLMVPGGWCGALIGAQECFPFGLRKSSDAGRVAH